MESIPYKQYTRTPRSQAVTNNFSGGMCYTNQPIQEGYCRLLVNYDVTNSGGGLSSRPGLFVTNHQIIKEYATDSPEFEAFDLTASKFLTEAQVRNIDWHYEPVYIFLKDAMVMNDREGLGTVCTILQNLSGDYVLSEQAQARCINPAPKTVFDFPFQNSRELLQPLYCTAWNDSFYTFLKDDTDNNTKLAYLEKNKTTVIEPKVPTELELENLGYNALQINMYNTIAPKTPLIPSFSINTKGWSGMDIGATDAYSIGIVDAVNLEAVDPMKLKPKTLYYVVINYHLPSSLIDQQIWSADKYADQERTVVFKLTEKIGDIFYPIDMEKYARKISLPVKDTLQLFYENSKGTVRTENTYYDHLQKHDLTTNSYTFVAGQGRYINDKTGYYGYREGTVPYAPKLLYFPFMTETGSYSKTLAVHLTERWKVSHNYSGSKETFKDILITVAALEDTEQDFSKRNNYTLASGKTLAFWKNRLWIGNVPEDPTMLFYSQTDMPEYFPYPSNTHIFTEPIIKLITMKDSLLVFTKSKLYSLSYTDELQLTIKCIQQNLYITEADAHLILTVKNMVFFKSGNYYYMVVPKVNSLTNELTIAPISKNITGFLDNFRNSVYTTLHQTYNITKEAFQELRLINYYNFLDYEDIINVFKFTTVPQEYEEESEKEYQDYYVLLLYNSVSRYWRLYTLCYPHMDNVTNRIQAVTNNATQRAEYILLKKVIGTKKYINIEQLNTVSVAGDSICLKDLSPLNKSLKITDTRPLDFVNKQSYEVLVSLGKRSCELEAPQDLEGPIHKLSLPFKHPEILENQTSTYFILQLQMSCSDTNITDASYFLSLKAGRTSTILSSKHDIDFSKPVTIIARIYRTVDSLNSFTEDPHLVLEFGFNDQFSEQAKKATITVSQLELWECESHYLKPGASIWITSESFNSFIVHRTDTFEGITSLQATYNNFVTETEPIEQGFIALETLKWDKTQVTDYHADKVQTVWSADLSYKDDQQEPEINNPTFHSLEISDIETRPIYTYLDTGYLTVAPTLKKRFREYQFGLARQVLEQDVDETSQTLAFDFTFYMDSEQRQHRIAFSPYLKVNSSGDFKQLWIKHFAERTVHPEYTLPTGVGTGSTIAEPREYDTDVMLETDMNYKIRIPISGKGYLPRFTLRTTYQKPYTIYNQALVYRTLNAR